MKKKTPSFLSRKNILNADQYEEYKRLKTLQQKEKYNKELKDLNKSAKKISYDKSRVGRIGNAIATSFSIFGTKGGVAKTLYKKKSVQGTGNVGRPKGTVKYTDPRTGQPIGVYEYRKILSARLAKERAVMQQRGQLSEQQIEYLKRIQQRRYAQRINPEGNVIPSTYGQVYLGGIMDEIDSSSNLVE